jgi:hypothetical protein
MCVLIEARIGKTTTRLKGATGNGATVVPNDMNARPSAPATALLKEMFTVLAA